MPKASQKPRPRGRPKLPKDQIRSVYRAFKVTPKEDRKIRAASKAAKMDDSEWIRRKMFGEPIAA
jgi:hypothetical protein